MICYFFFFFFFFVISRSVGSEDASKGGIAGM
jgi:hypothetical protein